MQVELKKSLRRADAFLRLENAIGAGERLDPSCGWVVLFRLFLCLPEFFIPTRPIVLHVDDLREVLS